MLSQKLINHHATKMLNVNTLDLVSTDAFVMMVSLETEKNANVIIQKIINFIKYYFITLCSFGTRKERVGPKKSELGICV